MQGENLYLFYLQNPDTSEYYFVDNTGAVDSQVSEIYLQDAIYGPNDPQAPEGWKDIEIKWVRSKIYWGLYRNFTTKFTFHKDAATILRSLFFSAGTNAKCRLIIKERDMANNSSAVTLNVLYSGDLDFFKCVPSKGRVEIPIKEAGLRDLFFQNENVTYEIPIVAPDAVTCEMDGIKLKGAMHYVGANIPSGYPFNTNTIFPINLSTTDGDIPIGVDQTVDFSNSSPTLGADDWFYKANRTETITVTLLGTIEFDVPVTGFTYDLSAAVEVATDENNTGTIAIETLYNLTAFNTPGTHLEVINYQFTVNVTAGNVLFFRALNFPSSLAAPAVANLHLNGLFTIDVESEFTLPTSTCLAYPEAIVFEKVVDAMTGGLYTADSTFLQSMTDRHNSAPGNTVYTSGDAIRGLSSAVLKITPRDFFRNIMIEYGLAICIEGNQVVAKPKSEVLDAATSIGDLGELKDLSAPIDEDFVCNSIIVGNAEQTYDGFNGKDEYMNTYKYKTALLYPQELDLIRPFRYDVYGIEATRYRLFDQTTTDNEADNDIFVWEVDISAGSPYPPRRAQNDPGCFATGVLFPDSKYNFSKSPLRVLGRNIDYIQGLLYYLKNEPITFLSTEKNSTLESNLDVTTDTYAENGRINTFVLRADPVASGIPYAPLFIPHIFKAKANVSNSLFAILNATPNGYFDFTYNGVAGMAFPMEIGMKYVTKGEYNVELLCHPAVDPADIDLSLER